MLESDHSGDLVNKWNQVQRSWWDGWFKFVGSVATERGVEAAKLWQNSFDTWRQSVEMSLQMQQNTAALWLQAQDNLTEQSRKLAPPVALELGASASLSKIISNEDILSFAQLSGDINPVHLDEDYAAKTRFKGRIAHGMLSAGLISAVLGTRLPGPGAVYLSQTLKFRAPVAIGDEITATATVLAQREGKPIYTLETLCRNQHGDIVLEGEAVILYDP